MKSFGQLSEDIEERRAAAKQRQKDQMSTFKMKGAAATQSAAERTDQAKSRHDAANQASRERDA